MLLSQTIVNLRLYRTEPPQPASFRTMHAIDNVSCPIRALRHHNRTKGIYDQTVGDAFRPCKVKPALCFPIDPQRVELDLNAVVYAVVWQDVLKTRLGH